MKNYFNHAARTVTALSLAMAGFAESNLLVYEGFDYPYTGSPDPNTAVSTLNGGTGWADKTGMGTLVGWDTHTNTAGAFVAIKQSGAVSDVQGGSDSSPTPFTNTYSGASNFIQNGNYAGPSAGKGNGSLGAGDHLSLWRTLHPTVTATFANGNTTWICFTTSRAFNVNARGPSLAIGAGILTTFNSGDRGNSTQSVNQIIGTYPNTAGTGGTDNGGAVLNGSQNFASKEAIAIGADTTNAGQVSGSYSMNVDGVGPTNVGWVGMYFAQSYDSSGVRVRSGPVGGIGGTLSNAGAAGTLPTAPADHGYWMQGGGGATLSLLRGYSNVNTPWAGYGDNASHVNVVIAKIQWGAGADQGGGQNSDLVSYAVAHDNDVLNEANFDSWALTWDTGRVSNKATYNQLSVAGGRYFLDEIRLATTFQEVIGQAAVPTGYAGWIAPYSLSPSNAAPDFDYDNDGLKNAIEFVLGTDPTVPDVASAVGPTADVDSPNLVFSFRRAIASKSADTSLNIEFGPNTNPFDSTVAVPAASAGGFTISPIDASYENVSYAIPLGAEPRQYARLKVLITP